MRSPSGKSLTQLSQDGLSTAMAASSNTSTPTSTTTGAGGMRRNSQVSTRVPGCVLSYNNNTLTLPSALMNVSKDHPKYVLNIACVIFIALWGRLSHLWYTSALTDLFCFCEGATAERQQCHQHQPLTTRRLCGGLLIFDYFWCRGCNGKPPAVVPDDPLWRGADPLAHQCAVCFRCSARGASRGYPVTKNP